VLRLAADHNLVRESAGQQIPLWPARSPAQ
jgi:hypothetical protein